MKAPELMHCVRPPFSELFPTSPGLFEAVKQAMAKWGL